jgi:sulfite exporter TauE/SafE
VSFLVAFLGGLAGSLHCVGMCGIFPVALAGVGGGPGRRWGRQLLYHCGRIQTLVAIGAFAGTAGAAFLVHGSLPFGERLLAVAAGSFMIVVGLEQLGLLARFTERGAALVQDTVRRALSGVMRSRSPFSALAVGVFNAFLPCQMIYAFAAQAASTASTMAGALTMLAFGLGTVPAMLALGIAPSLLSARVRAALSRAGAFVVLVYGVITLVRGLAPQLGHVHAAALW